jgi:hypothetical protein
MKEVYLLRHAELDAAGVPTPQGLNCAAAVGRLLPAFEVVITGGDPQTASTAEHMTGRRGATDPRAGMCPEFREHEQVVWGMAIPPGMDFLDYLEFYEGGVLFTPSARQGRAVKELAIETLRSLSDDGRGLIVSDGLTIASALPYRERSLPIAYCGGYRLADDRSMSRFVPPGVGA